LHLQKETRTTGAKLAAFYGHSPDATALFFKVGSNELQFNVQKEIKNAD